MTELDQRFPGPETAPSLIAMGYPAEVLQRWGLYPMAEHHLDPYATVLHGMRLQPCDRVLDVGCSTGRELVNWRRSQQQLRQSGGYEARRAHIGPLMGLDIANDFDLSQRAVEDEGLLPIEFILGDMHHIEREDSSLEGISSVFTLYEADDTEDTEVVLDEFQRLLHRDGVLGLATSDTGNKREQREDEKLLAEELGATPPPLVAAKFTTDIAEPALAKRYRFIEHLPLRTKFVITKANFDTHYPLYQDSLLSMRNLFNHDRTNNADTVRGGRLQEAIDEVVLPKVLGKIAASGAFELTIERDYFICRLPKR